MNKEQIGTSAVEQLLARTDLLMADINKNDKLPCWDGDVYVYKDPGKEKHQLLGRVPVQVKCQEDRRNNNTLYWKYSVKLSDIQNYYNDGGAIYFVVKTDGKTEVIYYKVLLPVDLLKIINQYNEQKQHTLGFKKFPTDPTAVQNVFIDFLRHQKLQSCLNQTGFKSPEELIKAGYDELFFEARVHTPLDLVGKEVYQYARHPLGNVACVDKVGIQQIKIANPVGRLMVAGHAYFNGFKVNKTTNTMEISFGAENIVLTFQNNQPKTFALNMQGTLSDHINTLEFIIAADANKTFSIENVGFQLGTATSSRAKRKQAIPMFKNNLRVLQNVKALFDFMGFDKDIPLNETLIRQLLIVSESVLKNKPVAIEHMNPYGLLRIKAGNGLLLFRAAELQDGTYLIRDLFNHPVAVLTRQGDSATNTPPSDHSSFLLLHETDFYTALNLDLPFIQKDVFSYLNGKDAIEALGLILVHYWLKLVKAFDKTGDQMFLGLATNALEQLKAVPDIPAGLRDSLYLNEMQLIKRQRQFTPTEISQLEDFIHRTDITEHRIAGYLLTDNMNCARKEFETLSDAEKERFKTYPMYKFWKE